MTANVPPAGPDPVVTAIAQLKSPAVDRRRDALRALANMELDKSAIAAVARAMQDPEHEIRSLAFRVLEHDPTSAPQEAIEQSSLDSDAGIRARSVALLGRSGRASALAVLVGRIDGEEDDAVIGAALGGAARLLETIEASRLAEHTAEGLARSIAGLSGDVRARYRREVGMIAAALPEPWIVAGVTSKDDRLRLGMAVLAHEGKGPAATVALSTRTNDASAEIRDMALEVQGPEIVTESAASAPVRAISDAEESNGFDSELEGVTIPVLMNALKDPQPAVRERAETALRAIKSTRIATWLVPKINSSEPAETAYLADVALRLGIVEAIPALVDHVLEMGPGRDRDQLSAALRGFSGIDELLAGWQSEPDAERRIAAIRLMGLIKGSSGIDAGLKDPSATVRLASIEAAAQGPMDEALSSALLATISSDSSAGVRLSAARAFLGSSSEERTKAAELALRDPDVELRRTGVELLSGVSGGETSLLVKALQDTDIEISGRAASILSQAPGPEALATLWNALRASSPEVRANIIEALLGFGPDVLGRLARQAYESGDPQERALGLAMLVRLGNGGGHDLLIDSLSDPATEVRAEALKAMVGRAQAMDVDAVGARVRDPHSDVRALAVSALASLDDDRTLPYLLDASHDPVQEVREAGREAILARSSASVAHMLIDALGTPNLRRTASDLLVKMGPVATDVLVASLAGASDDFSQDRRRHAGPGRRSPGVDRGAHRSLGGSPSSGDPGPGCDAFQRGR